MDIGGKIKRMRIEKQLTQEELANRCELSKGFISQLENNLTSPSIATLTDILDILGTNLREFFNEISDEKITFTKDDMFETEDEDLKYTLKWLVPNSQKEDKPHKGEEFGYVLAGSIILHLGDKKSKVKKGESFYFKPRANHYISNPGKKEARVVWVSTPPTF